MEKKIINVIDKSLFERSWNRRSFLKASLLVAVSSLFPVPAFSYARRTLPEGRLSLVNLHTHDKLTVRFRNASGEYDPGALKDLNWVLRCHYTGKVHEIDKDVIEFVNLVDKRCGGRNEIQVISGYRSPEYNRKLLNGGRGVAKHSMHLDGRAIDIRMPGVDLRKLRDEALDLKLGGVGYYKKSNFVHLDSGRFRTW
jgi:uncharacterized protein YcbK (DUF882 family)